MNKNRSKKILDGIVQQKQVDHAFNLIEDLFIKNQHMGAGVWISAMFALIASVCAKGGMPYEDFSQEISNMTDFYKEVWNQNESQS